MAKITIYGLAGTGKSSVARLLAEKLHIPNISIGGLIREKAKELGVTLAEFKEMRKKDPEYDFYADKYIQEYGKTHDDFVVESRLSWYFVPDSFKVKLACDFDERIRRISKRDGKSIEEQEKITLYREKTDADLYMNLYGIEDMNTDDHFDLILNSTSMGEEEIADKIISRLSSMA